MNTFAVHVSIFFDQETTIDETRRRGVALLGDIEYKAILL
jgi:hypothetical protein